MSNWHIKYTKRHLSRKLSFHRDKHYTYKKNYNILKVVVIFLVVLLIYFNWSFISTNLILAKEGFVKFYDNFLEGSFDEGMDVVENVDFDIPKKIEYVISSEPISDKTKAVELAIHKYTNIERVQMGTSELIWDDDLSDIAREHSLDMVERDFFDHKNPDGEDPTDRAIRNGFNRRKELGDGWYTEGIAENIGMMPTGNVEGHGYVSSNADSIGKAQVESWIGSWGHRENILNPQYSHLGVGVSYDGLYYIATQNFW